MATPIRLHDRLTDYLDAQHINYSNITHSPSYTAQQTAQSAHIPGKDFAKTVIIKMGNKFAMLVLRANDKVNFKMLEKELGSKDIELATEREFQDIFPGCEVGAMPPFGNIFNMDVFVDEKLSEDTEIAFNAGTHTDLIKLAYIDFARLVKPKILHNRGKH